MWTATMAGMWQSLYSCRFSDKWCAERSRRVDGAFPQGSSHKKKPPRPKVSAPQSSALLGVPRLFLFKNKKSLATHSAPCGRSVNVGSSSPQGSAVPTCYGRRQSLFKIKKVWRRPTLPPTGGSTMGAGGLNFRVRHGNGWDPSAVVTRLTIMLFIRSGKDYPFQSAAARIT